MVNVKSLVGMFVLVCVAAYAVLLTGCSHANFAVIPPAASIRVPPPVLYGEPTINRASIGQGVLVSNRLLTCAHLFNDHVFPYSSAKSEKKARDEQGVFPPGVVIVNGHPRRVLDSPRHGVWSIPFIDMPEVGSHKSLEMCMQDWVALELDQNQSDSLNIGTEIWTIGDGVVRPGDRLYLVRRDPILPELRCVPLAVVLMCYDDQENVERPFPRNLIGAIAVSDDTHFRSFSGGFVGKYIDDERGWEFVGIHIGSEPNAWRDKRVLYILRPPQEVLEWLAGAADVERTQADSPTTDAKSIER